MTPTVIRCHSVDSMVGMRHSVSIRRSYNLRVANTRCSKPRPATMAARLPYTEAVIS